MIFTLSSWRGGRGGCELGATGAPRRGLGTACGSSRTVVRRRSRRSCLGWDDSWFRVEAARDVHCPPAAVLASCCWQSPVGRAVGFRQSQPGGRVSQEQIGRWARNPGAGRGAEEQQGKPCRVSWAGEVDEGRTHSPVGSRSTGFFLWLQRAGRAAIGRAASRRAAGAGEAGGWRGGVGCQGRRVRARAVWLVMPS